MNDFDIRLAMKMTTLSDFYLDDSIIVEELSLPSTGSRIDIAVINGALRGYEIKSSCDTLVRLKKQIVGYTKVFDYLSIVTEEKYLKKIMAISPDWIDVLCLTTLDNHPSMITARNGYLNAHREGFYIAKMLRKEEMQALLNEYGILYKKSSRAWTLSEILAETLDIDDLAYSVRLKLKHRTDWKLYSKAGLRSLQSDDYDQSLPMIQHCRAY
jgi:hypothetical protein